MTREPAEVVQVQLKLKLRPAQERVLDRWLWRLTGAYNWAIRKVEADARNGIYYRERWLESLVRGHGAKVDIPAHSLQATVRTAFRAWERCWHGQARKPRLKGRRNRLNSIPFPDAFRSPKGNTIMVAVLGRVRFHSQEIPVGRFKSGRLIKRASGWHLCLLIEASPRVIEPVGCGEIGIDPGFRSLATLSTGESIDNPSEMAIGAARVGQAQRGMNRRLTARLIERQSNRRKDRNHKLSRRLVSEHALICWSSDRHKDIARAFGKSVAGAAHGQLRQMLAYKSSSCGREFVEVPCKYSTVTCSACGARSGPTGYAGLSVRQWRCGCGAEHDRDVNAAINTLHAGRGLRLERTGNGSPEIAA